MLSRSKMSSSTTSTVSPALADPSWLVVMFRSIQQSADLVGQFAQVIRFGQKRVGKVDRLLRPAARTDDALDLREARVRDFGQRHAIHTARHADVGKQQMDGQGALQDGQRFI